MAKPLPQPFDKRKVVAENRRARFDDFVEERFEAGLQLTDRWMSDHSQTDYQRIPVGGSVEI